MPALDRRWEPLPVKERMRIPHIPDDRANRLVVDVRIADVEDGEHRDEREADQGNREPR